MASTPRDSAAEMMLGMLRYDSDDGASPMQTASSASWLCRSDCQYVIDARAASRYKSAYLHVQAIAVSSGVDGNCLQAKLLAGADDAHGNLAAVGDEHLFEAGRGSNCCSCCTARGGGGCSVGNEFTALHAPERAGQVRSQGRWCCWLGGRRSAPLDALANLQWDEWCVWGVSRAIARAAARSRYLARMAMQLGDEGLHDDLNSDDECYRHRRINTIGGRGTMMFLKFHPHWYSLHWVNGRHAAGDGWFCFLRHKQVIHRRHTDGCCCWRVLGTTTSSLLLFVVLQYVLPPPTHRHTAENSKQMKHAHKSKPAQAQ